METSSVTETVSAKVLRYQLGHQFGRLSNFSSNLALLRTTAILEVMQRTFSINALNIIQADGILQVARQLPWKSCKGR